MKPFAESFNLGLLLTSVSTIAIALLWFLFFLSGEVLPCSELAVSRPVASSTDKQEKSLSGQDKGTENCKTPYPYLGIEATHNAKGRHSCTCKEEPETGPSLGTSERLIESKACHL